MLLKLIILLLYVANLCIFVVGVWTKDLNKMVSGGLGALIIQPGKD